MMRAGKGHMASKVLTAILIASFVFISSCTQEKIVEVLVEVPADCPPSAPRGIYAVNLDGEVEIRWYPNPEDDIEGYDIWALDTPYGNYEYIGTVWVDEFEDPNPYEYYFVYQAPSNGEQLYYAVSAFDEADNISDLSYEIVSATPRPEGLMVLAAKPDSCGYDFSTLSSVPQYCTNPSTDIMFDTMGGVNIFSVAIPRVDIQDYGFTDYEFPYGLDAVNYAPIDGWSDAGSVEVIAGHCYMLRLGEADGNHYVKLWVSIVADGYVDLYWAYQTDPFNRDLMPGPAGDENGSNSTLTSGSNDTGGIKIMNGFPKGRQVPPTKRSGKQDDDRILQRQNTLP